MARSPRKPSEAPEEVPTEESHLAPRRPREPDEEPEEDADLPNSPRRPAAEREVAADPAVESAEREEAAENAEASARESAESLLREVPEERRLPEDLWVVCSEAPLPTAARDRPHPRRLPEEEEGEEAAEAEPEAR